MCPVLYFMGHYLFPLPVSIAIHKRSTYMVLLPIPMGIRTQQQQQNVEPPQFFFFLEKTKMLNKNLQCTYCTIETNLPPANLPSRIHSNQSRIQIVLYALCIQVYGVGYAIKLTKTISYKRCIASQL